MSRAPLRHLQGTPKTSVRHCSGTSQTLRHLRPALKHLSGTSQAPAWFLASVKLLLAIPGPHPGASWVLLLSLCLLMGLPGARRNQREPAGTRRRQADPGGAKVRRSQEKPGGAMTQEAPVGDRRSHENPEGPGKARGMSKG